MRYFFILLMTFCISACSSLLPYKDLSFDSLYAIAQNPVEYENKVVSFGGTVKGIIEDTRHLRFVLRIEAPLYYAISGKENLQEDQLLVVHFLKEDPAMTGISKENNVKILARVHRYETRTGSLGNKMGVLHLEAFAVADRTVGKDFFHLQSPDQQLYISWKEGKLFFKETVEEIEKRYPVVLTTEPEPLSTGPIQEKKILPQKQIIFDEEEEYVLPQ